MLCKCPEKNCLFQARSQHCEMRLLASSCLSVCPSVRLEQLGSHRTYFYEILYLGIFFWNICGQNSKIHETPTRITGTLHEDLCTFVLVFHWILLRMRNVSDKSCRGYQNTHFVFSIFVSRKSCRLWASVLKKTKCIVAFPPQHWLHQRATMLCRMYNAHLVIKSI